jgi:kynureninase
MLPGSHHALIGVTVSEWPAASVTRSGVPKAAAAWVAGREAMALAVALAVGAVKRERVVLDAAHPVSAKATIATMVPRRLLLTLI